ncbi:Hypothetical protein D9617_3g019240 [Elsinoe fawcettii]|nr:Hypothetical protein D9617_3g019240 [Elsinoe fawcettii]
MSLKFARLEQLPPEVFAHIVSYIDDPRSVGALSRTSKSLHVLVETHGWQVFAVGSFPSYQSRPVAQSSKKDGKTSIGLAWREIARSLLGTARSWDQRAFQASFIQPSGSIVQLQPAAEIATDQLHEDDSRRSGHFPGSRLFRSTPGHSPARSDSSGRSDRVQAVVTPKLTTRWKLPRGQTMGFTPVIDCYESVMGDKWTDRKEALAYSAGSELIIRLRQKPLGNHTDESSYTSRWATYRPPNAKEGVDDITFVKFLDQSSLNASNDEELLLGTAAGSLQHLSMRVSNSKRPFNIVRQTFETNNRPVQSASLQPIDHSNGAGLLATILADLSLNIFPVNSKHVDHDDRDGTTPGLVKSIADLRLADDGIRAWRTSFLSSSLLAVTLGPSEHPIHVYQVRPDGLSEGPISKFSIFDRQNNDGHVTPKSVYPVEPLWDGNGQVFASGGYDGFVRIHDTRSPAPVQYLLYGLEDGPIYSLLPRPNAHILAGAARHNVCKVFDLRNKGAYLQPSSANSSNGDTEISSSLSRIALAEEPAEEPLPWRTPRMTSIPRMHTSRASTTSATWSKEGSYNLYIPKQATRNEGPVYSLASPSPSSPFIYMGLENSVVEMRLDSSSDKHRDPILSMTSEGDARDERRNAKKQNRRPRDLERDVLQLKSSSLKGELIGQGPVQGRSTGRGNDGGGRSWLTIDGLNERWINPRRAT